MGDTKNFSWDRFDPASLEAFSRVFFYKGTQEHGARADFLGQKFQKPTIEFVSKSFHVILNVWFRKNEKVAAGVVNAGNTLCVESLSAPLRRSRSTPV